MYISFNHFTGPSRQVFQGGVLTIFMFPQKGPFKLSLSVRNFEENISDFILSIAYSLLLNGRRIGKWLFRTQQPVDHIPHIPHTVSPQQWEKNSFLAFLNCLSEREREGSFSAPFALQIVDSRKIPEPSVCSWTPWCLPLLTAVSEHHYPSF